MRIRDVLLFDGTSFVPGEIEFGETVTRVGSTGGNARGLFLLPGLVDIHTHGAVGLEAGVCGTGGLERLSLFYASRGVTSWCPTAMSMKEPELLSFARSARDFRRPEKGARLAGLHLEGPFLSPEKRGAHKAEDLLLPDADLVRRVNEASGGMVKLIAVAPELPGATELIRELSQEMTVSLGHTAADYDTCMRAYAAGASQLTHAFNAMPPLLHRAPGPVGAAMDGGAAAELIADGIHVHPSAIRAAWRMFGDRMILISDSIPCCGMPDGAYGSGGMEVEKNGRRAVLAGTETLAGSCTDLLECLRQAVKAGVPLEKAVRAAAAAPAAAVGDADAGSLEPGKAADFIILDRELELKAVFIGGKQVFGEPLETEI